MKCKSCGDLVDPRRVELGYDYCLKDECQQRCIQPVQLASIGINKAADYYVRAEEVLPPRAPRSSDSEAVEEKDNSTLLAPSRPTTAPSQHRPPSTIERLRELERELDAGLDRSYQRFVDGELTAVELDRERDALIRGFNQEVMAANIRYRSLLRRPKGSGEGPSRARARSR